MSHNNYNAPQLKKVKIYYGESAHTHSFTYSASGATITATCGGTGTCDITEGLTLTISAPTGSLVYDGTTTYPATLSTGYNTTAFPDTYNISYTKDGSAYDGAPKDAGTYTASVTAGTGDGAKTASVGYTIAKAVPTINTAPTARNLTYTGSAQALVEAGSAEGGELRYSLNGTDYSADIPTGTEIDTYTVYYKVFGDDNHSDTEAAHIDVRIDPVDAGSTAPSADTLTYTGAAQALVTGGSVTGGELQYALGTDATTEPKDGAFSPDVPTGTNAGTYFVWYRVKGDANHNDVAPSCIEVPIAKAAIAPTVSITGWTYGETANAPSVAGNTGNGAVKYEYSDNESKGFGKKVPSKVNNYFVRAVVAETDNYLGATTRPLSFAIAKASLTVVADAKTKVEGESDPKLTYTVTGLVGSDKLTGALAREAGEAAGSYAITQGTLKATDNYDMSFTGAQLTITAKATPPKPQPVPAKPDVTLLAKMWATGKTTMAISWTKVDDASGYDVFFKSCGKGTCPKIATVKSGEPLRYEITGLKRGATYRAYVKAWKKVKGKKTYIGKSSPRVHVIAGGYKEKYANAKSVTVSKPEVKLVKGKSSTIKASVKVVKSGKSPLEHAKILRYYSSDRNVARVTSAGKIKAKGAGSCTIYVVANNGVRASVKVTVIDQPTEIAFKSSSYSVRKGKTRKLADRIKLAPAGVTTTFTWTSSDSSIATVSKKGVVKGRKKGTVTITATSANGLTATTEVKVR